MAEQGGYYEVRVVGGTVYLPAAAVFRVDQDACTIAALSAAESASTAESRAADEERVQE